MAAGDITYDHLSGSTHGEEIKVTGNGAGSAVTVHTADATDKDFLTLTVTNIDTSARILYLQKGSGDYVNRTVGAGRTLQLWNMMPIMNGLTVKAYADTVDKLYIDGRLNRVEVAT